MVLGIDMGGSTTKIAAFNDEQNIAARMQITSTSDMTKLHSAIGKMMNDNGINMDAISQIVLCGVGASYVDSDIYGIPTRRVDELKAVGHGGLYLTQLNEAIVVSVGTGTAFVRADRAGMSHIGGSGIGGGTLVGLASQLLGETDIDRIATLAQQGNLANVDLLISDISRSVVSSLPSDTTASNFGKTGKTAAREDIALGLLNSIFQTVGIMAAFACINTSIDNIVVTGSLASIGQAQKILDGVGALHRVKYIVPEDAIYATTIGAVRIYYNEIFNK